MNFLILKEKFDMIGGILRFIFDWGWVCLLKN